MSTALTTEENWRVVSERRALQFLAKCIGKVVGVRSEAYRNVLRAAQTGNVLDLYLARLSFEALDAECRGAVLQRVVARGRSHGSDCSVDRDAGESLREIRRGVSDDGPAIQRLPG